jgi:two-component system, NarL family, invasion response regulator UvrY
MPAPPAPTLRTIRVLTADDHPGFLATARELIAATPGFESVGEADSGERAVELAGELRPDLVLLDVHMPGIGGIAAARRIVDARPGIVVALVSAYAVSDLPSDVLSCGARAVLAKHRLSPETIIRLWALPDDPEGGAVTRFEV